MPEDRHRAFRYKSSADYRLRAFRFNRFRKSMMVKDGDTIVVWFSCGAASALAAKLIVRCYGHRCNVRVVNNPISNEDSDNGRFLKDIEKWIGQPIESSTNYAYPNCDVEEVFEKRSFMSGPKGAPCTIELKKKARQQWEDRNEHQWMVMGFTADEVGRSDRFKLTERDNLLPILIDAGLTKEDCFQILHNAGVELPLAYRLGYPNANCIGCVKATSPTYWNHVRKVHPEVFAKRAEQSRRIGCKLVRVKNERIYLDELDPAATGRPMKSLQMPDCGNFCEEHTARVSDRSGTPQANEVSAEYSEERDGFPGTPKPH